MIQKQILPAVAAVIFDAEGKVLLQRRGDTKKWCIISGHVEFGETVHDAILREIMEELNVRSEVLRLIGVYSTPQYTTYALPDKTVQYVVTCFEVRLLEDISEQFRNSESEEIVFFDINNLPPDLDLINPHWLQDALASRMAITFIR